MRCPNCNGLAFVVTSLRYSDEQIRKRVCARCGAVFYTAEKVDDNAKKKLKIGDADRHRKVEDGKTEKQ